MCVEYSDSASQGDSAHVSLVAEINFFSKKMVSRISMHPYDPNLAESPFWSNFGVLSRNTYESIRRETLIPNNLLTPRRNFFED